MLLVEDNNVTRKLVRFTLSASELDVFEATCGADVPALAARCRPEVVLLDLLLPDATGFELLGPLRAQLGPQTPILAFTGLMSAANENRLANAGFDDVIYKPVDPSKLREIVHAYLPRKAASSVVPFGAGRTLLLADDDAVQRKLTAYRLARLGFTVETAEDGIAALERARVARPDVVVTDLLMPRADGYELCARLRSEPHFDDVPVVLLTNNFIEATDRQLAARVGADAYVVRTHTLDELIDSLQNVLLQRPTPKLEAGIVAELEGERSSRAARQLERQIALNSTLSARSALLAAELSIVGGLTTALATQRNAESALDDALSLCFDAGGISWGVLLVKSSGVWRYRSIGLSTEELDCLPAPDELLVTRLGLRSATTATYPIVLDEVFAGSVAGHGLVAPIVHRGALLGALILGIGPSPEPDENRAAFASVIANQIALALALADAFTELERVSRGERERAEILTSVIEAIGQPLVVLGTDGLPGLSNSAAGSVDPLLLGSEDAGPGEALLADQSRAYEVDELPMRRALRGEAVTDEELLVRRDGDSRWYSVTARPVRGPDPDARGAVAIVREVTEEKRVQARQVASERLAAIGMLAAGVAHEVNNPLTAVIAEVDMALEDLAPLGAHPAIDRLEAAREAASRVRTIVKDLRTLSRESSDTLRLVDVNVAVEAASRMAAPQVRKAAMFEKLLGPVPVVMANEARLVQVFLNLMVNAAQAIGEHDPRQHVVRARSYLDGEHVVIEISDTGPGMDEATRAKLFTPFFTTKPAGVGTGLGLSISHRIVSGIGGAIACESEVGTGTTFRVVLPRADTRSLHPKPLVSLPPPPAPLSCRILVVHDNPLDLQLLARILKARHEVATSIDAALGPQLDGAWDLVLCPRELAAGLPADVTWIEVGTSTLETEGALSKPFTPTKVLDLVEAMARRKEKASS